MPLTQISFQSPLGQLVIDSNGHQLIHIYLDNQSQSTRDISSLPSCLVLAKQQLIEYFNGIRKSFDLPITIPGSGVINRIYESLLQVHYGNTTSYAMLAKQTGILNGARVVGSAMAKNPIPLIIPCHRVIHSNGLIGGYSLGGEKNKKFLIQLEKTNPG